MTGTPPDGEDDDAAVIRQSQERPEIFALLYDRYAPDIHRYAARRLGDGAADDITADTFLTAFRIRARFDTTRESARPWLYGIAANLIGKQRRKETRGLRALARTGRDPVAESWVERADSRVTAEAAQSALAGAVADLPDDPAKVLDKVLKFYPSDSEGSETPDEHAFRALGLMFVEQPIVHPKGLAKVFRAMAEIPGTKASRVTDTAGRETIAVARKDSGGPDADLRTYLLDPATGLPVGQQWTAGKDSPTGNAAKGDGGSGDGGQAGLGEGVSWKKGDVVMADLVLQSALVAKDHQRP